MSPSRGRRIFRALAIILLLSGTALAASADVDISVTPSTVKLSPNQSAQVVIVAHNNSHNKLSSLRLEPLGRPEANFEISSSPLDALSLGGSAIWGITITRASERPASGTIYFRLNYALESGAPGVIVGAVEVQDREPDPIEKVAAIRTETALDLIQEKRKGIVFLVVSNLSSSPLTLDRIELEKPTFVKIENPHEPGHGAFAVDANGVVQLEPDAQILAPQESRAFGFTVTAGDAVPSGKHMLLFKVYLTQEKYGYRWRGSLIAVYKTNVGVLGESEILTALGVPSFLLLPGFLALISFRLAGGSTSVASEARLKGPEFWTVAILLSIIAALSYPLITGLFGQSRDYVEGYGLRDVISVWLASMVAGAMFRGLWSGAIKANAHFRGLYIPSGEDGPAEILLKLARNRRGLNIRQVALPSQTGEKLVFDVTPRFVAGLSAEIWISPPILVSWKTAESAEEIQTLKKLKARYSALQERENAKDMAEFLVTTKKTSQLNFAWKPLESIAGPQKLAKSTVKFLKVPISIVEEVQGS